ncbi:MAG: hypothetical protein ACTHPO_06925 [Alphaproteobacteria bacterium]
MDKTPPITGYTLRRSDIVQLARNIAGAVPLEMLSDKKHPLTIAIKGSYKCGKKCFVDSFIEAAINLPPCPLEGTEGWEPEKKEDYRAYLAMRHRRDYSFQGNEGKDESVIARGVNGQMMQFLYLDMHYTPYYFSFCQGTDNPSSTMAAHQYNALREYGGVTLLQNTDGPHDEAEFPSDIEIWLENKHTNFSGAELRCPDKSKLAGAFNDDAKKGDWRRYVEVRVHNPDLSLVVDACKPVFKEFKMGAV